MNKKMKKTAMLLAAATMASQAIIPVSADEVCNAEGFPIVNEEVTIRILTQSSTQATDFTDMNDAPAWKYIEELTGVNIEIEEYTSEDLATKLPLIMSDPDNMPDILWQAKLGEDNTMAYGEEGLLLDMSPYLEKYGPNIIKTFESDAAFEGFARSADGGLYSLPSYNGEHGGYFLVINQRWMDNCGITELPTTLEEFKDMLIKFRDMDANGNGDATDEIPLQANNNSLWAVMGDSVGMMGTWPYIGATWYADDNSTEVHPTFASDRYRYAVEYVKSLYDEGLMNQDYLTTQEGNARRLSDIHGVLVYQTWPTKEEKYDPDEWVVIPCPKSELYDMEYQTLEPAYQTNMAAITSNTKYPEVCVRILDYAMSVEGSAIFSAINPKDYDVEALKEAGMSEEAIELCAEFRKTVDTGIDQANLFGTYGCRNIKQLSQYKLPTTEYANNIQKTIQENIRDVYHKNGKTKNAFTYSLKFLPEESEVIAQYQADIDTYVKDKLSQWVTGGEELNDDTWNAYIKQLEAMEVDQLTDAYQAAANRWYGVEAEEEVETEVETE